MKWPMTIMGLLTAAVLASACGGGAGTIECDERRLYQDAVAGKRIEVPEGLDSLSTDRELTVPVASPQAPPPPGTCLDAPPTLSTSSGNN
jgi:uncharacterized lipoprotein